jgi:hypothetical protein
MLRNLFATITVCAALICGASLLPAAATASPSDGTAAGAVAHAARKAPNVRCYRLDRAKDKLRAAGYRVRVRGGGLFGVVVESNWVVVSQAQSGSTVTVYVDRGC